MTTLATRPAATAAPPPRAGARGPRVRRTLYWIATHAVAVALSVMFLGPLVFVALTALMTDDQALTGDLWPDTWNWGNFVEVFTRSPC